VTPDRSDETSAERVCIVGSGMQFVSGISYYTYFLAATFTKKYETSVVLMRKLVPRRFYPGRDRVGAPISDLHVSSMCPVFDGVDWFAIPSLPRAGRFLRHQHPDVVVFQWWTGAVLPSYLYLLGVARRGGARVILEFHEDQDTGEASLPLVERIVRPGLRRLIGFADYYVVHSEWDKDRLCKQFSLDPAAVSVIPIGPFEMGRADELPPGVEPARGSSGTHETITVLFFGTIRPYKGLEDLIDAFGLLPRHEGVEWRLLVVGETWEGWDLPERKIRSSPFAGDIEFINRYVTDAEIPGLYSRADIVALPYHRSSASGPLHLTMQLGLPVVITDVGGLSEAARDYSGTVFVPPRNPRDLADGIVASVDLRGVRHPDVHTWDTSLDLFSAVIDRLVVPATGHSEGGP
jgi:glycosyltransferase involved in cell wall biosynthesis